MRRRELELVGLTEEVCKLPVSLSNLLWDDTMMEADYAAGSCGLAFSTYDLELRLGWRLFSGLHCLTEAAYHVDIINSPLTGVWC